MQVPLNHTMDEMNKWGNALEALISTMRMEKDELKGELALVWSHEAWWFVAHHGPRVDIQRPKEFKGSRVAKDVDNFL